MELNWNKIHSEYLEGKSFKELSIKYNIHHKSIRRAFKRLNLSIFKHNIRITNGEKFYYTIHEEGEKWVDRNGRIRIKIGNIIYFEHRYLFEKKYGIVPKGFVIHHIDENKQNNNIENLKMLSIAEHNKIHKTKGDFCGT